MSEEFFLSQLGFLAKFTFMQVSAYAGNIFESHIKELENFDKAVDETAILVGKVWSDTFKQLIKEEMRKM